MNPSYNNGGPNVPGGAGNIPGAKPGVIASGPGDASVPIASGPNMPATPVPNAPVVSRQPTGGRPMSNEIVLTPDDGAKKRKRNLIIAGALAGVIVVAVLAAVIIVVARSGGSNNNTSSNADYNLFSNYVNYLLNTSNNTNAEITKYDKYEDYAIQLAYYDNNTQYFQQLEKLWNNFYTKITEENKYSSVSKIMGDISYQNELMDFITKYMANTKWDEGELLELYIDEGLADATETVNNSYNDIASTIYEPGKTYAEGALKNAILALNTYSKYQSLGCIVNKAVNFECLERNSTSITTVKASDLAEVDENLPEDTIEALIRFAFKINDDFGSLEG